jgi:cation diffusion facilitator CzcD-associated flavoprotein CzcO
LQWVALAGGETLSTQFMVAATGFLSQPRTPDIPSIETFSGCSIHTAAWDDDYAPNERRTAVIGTGSTVVQVIPELAKEVSELTVYRRTPIWVLPKSDIVFPPAVQRLFAKVPVTQRIVRWFTDTGTEFMMVITMWKYRRFKLNPDFDFGCKRPTLSNSCHSAFTKPHVHLETSGIERLEPEAIVARDGRFPGAVDHAARRFGVSPRQLRNLAVVLVQEPHRQRGSTAFPADVGA